MPKKQHSEQEIISALKQYESGEKTADICRKLGVSQATFYMWKKQYAGLGVQELRELRSRREENGRLKRIVADLTQDRQILQEIVSKRLYSLASGVGWRGGRKRRTGYRSAVPHGLSAFRGARCSTPVRGRCRKLCACGCASWRQPTCAMVTGG